MKRILFLLSAIALAAPAGAAEVGVRHTWGHTTSSVTNGRSATRSQSHGSFAEISGGGSGAHTGGSGFIRSERGSYSSRTRESFNFGSRSTTGFSESSTFSR